MLHRVHQLVTNCVCLWFGAEQEAYSRSLELLSWKLLPAAAENAAENVAVSAMRVNQEKQNKTMYLKVT